MSFAFLDIFAGNGDENGPARGAGDFFGELVSITTRHLDVEDAYLRLVPLEGLRDVIAAVDVMNNMAFIRKNGGQRRDRIQFVAHS